MQVTEIAILQLIGVIKNHMLLAQPCEALLGVENRLEPGSPRADTDAVPTELSWLVPGFGTGLPMDAGMSVGAWALNNHRVY